MGRCLTSAPQDIIFGLMEKVRIANVGKKLTGAAQVLLEVGDALVTHRSQQRSNFAAGRFVDSFSAFSTMLALDKGDMKRLSKVVADVEIVIKNEEKEAANRPDDEEPPLDVALFMSDCGGLIVERARVFLDENANTLRLAIKRDQVELLGDNVLKGMQQNKFFDPLGATILETQLQNLCKLIAKIEEDLWVCLMGSII